MPLIDLPELHESRAKAKETVKLINRIRLRLNNFPDVVASETLITAGTGTYEVIWGSAVETNTAYKLTASVIGATADGVESEVYTIEAGIINNAGVVTFVGGTQQKTFERETNPATDAKFTVAAGIVGLEVLDSGGGVQQTLWHARIYAEKLK